MSRCARSRLAVLGAALLLGGCGDASGPSPLPAELVGSWVAEPACVPAGCGLTVHALARPDTLFVTRDLGITTEMDLGANGSFRLRTVPALPGAPALEGTARVEGGRLIVRAADGQEEAVEYTLAGGLLVLRFDVLFDFDADGTAEAARAEGTFRKR
jgi:hypothetical protein